MNVNGKLKVRTVWTGPGALHTTLTIPTSREDMTLVFLRSKELVDLATELLIAAKSMEAKTKQVGK